MEFRVTTTHRKRPGGRDPSIDRKTVTRYHVWASGPGLLNSSLPPIGELQRFLEVTLNSLHLPQNMSSVVPFREPDFPINRELLGLLSRKMGGLAELTFYKSWLRASVPNLHAFTPSSADITKATSLQNKHLQPEPFHGGNE